MLYFIKNRIPLKEKLQYIMKSIKRGFLESESYLDNVYQHNYDAITLEYLEKFQPEEYKLALERLSFIDSDSNTLRNSLGSITYGILKSIFILTVVTPIILVHHAAAEIVYLSFNMLSLLGNRTSNFFETFSTHQKPEKSRILSQDEAKAISIAKEDLRMANSSNDRHISFELPEQGNTDDRIAKRSSISEENRSIISRKPGYLNKIRSILESGKTESLKSMQEDILIPTLQQYREYLANSNRNITTSTLPNRLILAGRFSYKC